MEIGISTFVAMKLSWRRPTKNRNLILAVLLLMGLVSALIGPGQVVQAHECQETFRTDSRKAISAFLPPRHKVDWRDKNMWEQTIGHSVDFFLAHGWDVTSGSFASELNNDGTHKSEIRHLIASSRLLYGLAFGSRKFPEYLSYAQRLSDFILDKMVAYDGQNRPYFKNAVDPSGRSIQPQLELVVNEQAYGLTGLVALYTVTRDAKLLEKVQEFFNAFDQRFYDQEFGGYFDRSNIKTRQTSPTKSYNSTVYVATSFLLDLALLDTPERSRYLNRVIQLANIISRHFVDTKTGWIRENFSPDWHEYWWEDWRKQTIDTPEGPKHFTIGVVGHNFQAAWLLMRTSQIQEISSSERIQYLSSARFIISSMLKSKAIDRQYGGVFDVFRREDGEWMWHTNKDWWQQAEAVLALTLSQQVNLFGSVPNVPQDLTETRDQILEFYLHHFIDSVHGGEFFRVTKEGVPIHSNETGKGAAGKSAYHTVELARLMVEYAKLSVPTIQRSHKVTDENQYKMNLAMQAAARGDLGTIQDFVASDGDLTFTNRYDASLLYYAAQAPKDSVAIYRYVREQIGDLEFSTLLKKVVRPNHHSLALEAVFNANSELIEYLLQLREEGMPVDFETPTVFGWTPKTFAERENLVFASKLPEGRVAAKDRAAWLKNQDDIWYWNQAPDLRKVQDRGLRLMTAIQKQDLVEVDQLISITSLNKHYGRLQATLLNSSVRPEMTEAEIEQAWQIQERLIAFGADPNFAEGGIMMVPSGFREAVFGYDILLQKMIEHLLRDSKQRAIYLNIQGPLNGYTKLIDAALRGKADVIRVLVKAGADKTLRGHNGLTAIAAAQIYNRQSKIPIPDEVMRLLNLKE